MKLEIAFKYGYANKEQALRDVLSTFADTQFTISKTDDVHLWEVVLIAKHLPSIDEVTSKIESGLENKGLIAIATQST